MNDIDLAEGFITLQNSFKTLEELKKKKDDIVGSQKLFNLPITTFPEIKKRIKNIIMVVIKIKIIKIIIIIKILMIIVYSVSKMLKLLVIKKYSSF